MTPPPSSGLTRLTCPTRPAGHIQPSTPQLHRHRDLALLRMHHPESWWYSSGVITSPRLYTWILKFHFVCLRSPFSILDSLPVGTICPNPPAPHVFAMTFLFIAPHIPVLSPNHVPHHHNERSHRLPISSSRVFAPGLYCERIIQCTMNAIQFFALRFLPHLLRTRARQRAFNVIPQPCHPFSSLATISSGT